MNNFAFSSRVGALPVGSVSAPLWGFSPNEFLSTRELALLGRIQHPRRRQQSLAARILAKYLLLSEVAVSTVLRVVDVGQLLSIPACEYRMLHIMPDRCGAPAIWYGQALAARTLSLSHTAGWAVAALSGEGSIGIDCEVVEARQEAFLRCNFSHAEQEWVNCHTEMDGPTPEWLYTLLWSFKEAATKTGRVASSRAIDVHIRSSDGFPEAANLRLLAVSRELITLDWYVGNLAPSFAFTALPNSVVAIVHFPWSA
jgi:hypothetical protein